MTFFVNPGTSLRDLAGGGIFSAEAPAEGPKALTPSGAKARAEARRAKAKAGSGEKAGLGM